MRPKLIAILAVSAFALVGCGAAEPSVEPTATVTVTATPEPEVAPETETTSSEKPASLLVEDDMFADFAETRAAAHGAKKPNREKVIDALYEFCEDDTPFDVSSSEALNENLEMIAKKEACPNAN